MNTEIHVTKSSLTPPVVYAGPEDTAGSTVSFTFSEDWDGLSKYIVFFNARGQAVEVPYLGGEITIPPEIMMYGGPSKFNVTGVQVDGTGALTQKLKVTGTVTVSYNIGQNPRLAGRLTPSTLELFLTQAEQFIITELQRAKDSGEFKGDTGDPAGFDTPLVHTVTLESGEQATVTISADGPDTRKVFSFEFGIPRGEDGDSGVWVSDTLDTPPERDQNLWIVQDPDTDEEDIYIPDGLVKQGRLVYLTCEGEKIGPGADVDGRNFTILGTYPDYATLVSEVIAPQAGDAYGVGDSAPYDVYVWTDVPALGYTWKNYGPLGNDVDTELSSTSTYPVQNKAIYEALADLADTIPTVPTSLKNPYALTLFGQSYDGSAAVTVAADGEMSDSSVKPVQNGVVKAYIDGLIGDVDAALDELAEIIGGESA